jgi:hypothetical protein
VPATSSVPTIATGHDDDDYDYDDDSKKHNRVEEQVIVFQ